MKQKKIKLVMAGSKMQFQNWCRGNQLNIDDYKYISMAKDIYGHKNCVVYRIGHYYLTSDFGEINAYCEANNIKPVFLEVK